MELRSWSLNNSSPINRQEAGKCLLTKFLKVALSKKRPQNILYHLIFFIFSSGRHILLGLLFLHFPSGFQLKACLVRFSLNLLSVLPTFIVTVLSRSSLLVIFVTQLYFYLKASVDKYLQLLVSYFCCFLRLWAIQETRKWKLNTELIFDGNLTFWSYSLYAERAFMAE